MLSQSSKLANLSQSVLRNLPLNPNQLKRYVADKCCPPGTTQTAKGSKDAPDSAAPFKNDAFTPPEFLPITAYRPLCDPKEILGPGAHKCKTYKNPEYFAYHRFSFFELQNATLKIAKSTQGGVLYEAESDQESEDECVESDSEVEVLVGKKDGAKETKECKENNGKLKTMHDKSGEEKKLVDTEAKQDDGEVCEK